MTNISILAVYSPFFLICAGALVFTLKADRCGRLGRNAAFCAASFLGWHVFNGVYYLSKTEEMARFLYDLDLPFITLGSMAVFLMVMRFYNLEEASPPEVVAVLLVVPVITAVLALTSRHHPFLCTSLEFTSLTPLVQAVRVRGVGFWMHTIYCYVLTAVSIGVSIVQHFKLPKRHRRSSRILFLLMISSLVGNALVLTKVGRLPLDYSLIGGSVAVLAACFVCVSYRDLDFLIRTRDDIFHFVDEAVFTLDGEGMVISRNRAAEILLKDTGLDPGLPSYQAIRSGLRRAAKSFEQSEIDGEGVDYHITLADGREAVYNLRDRPMQDKQGTVMGNIIIVTDMTENRAMIRRLEVEAGIDALTGLANRRQMEVLQKKLDTPEHLPLSVIMGDLNHLKKVNDSMGHQQGDILLRAAAEILVTCCPPNARIGRVGGDEFMILLPSTPLEQAQTLTDRITAHMARANSYPFEVSMALGAAVKQNQGRELSTVINEADQIMYRNKALSGKARKKA